MPLRDVWVSLVLLRNGCRIRLHSSKSPVPRRWSLCVDGPISSSRSVGRQGSSRGDSAVSPTCSPKSLERSLNQEVNVCSSEHRILKNNSGRLKAGQSDKLCVSLVSSCSFSDEILLISLACSVSSETQKGGHVNTINVIGDVSVTSQVEFCK